MNIVRTLAAASLLIVGLPVSAFAECVYPKTPASAPNGNTATEAEMIAGKEAFTKYQTEVTGYLDCLDKESKARIAEAGEDAEQVKKIKQMTMTRHNAAIDELQARADEFNQQLRAFKNKSKS